MNTSIVHGEATARARRGREESGRHGTSVLGRLIATLGTWQERASDRAHLRDLDARLLEDMGLSARDAKRESTKHFWTA